MKPELTTWSVTGYLEPPSVTVQRVWLMERGEHVAALSVGTQEKRPEVVGFGSDGELPTLLLAMGEDKPIAQVAFDAFPGWIVWSATPNRYDVCVCLVRRWRDRARGRPWRVGCDVVDEVPND